MGGALPYFTGARVQRGHGFGSLFSGLLRTVAPLIKRGAVALGKRALATGAQIAGDVVAGKNVKKAAKRRATAAGRNLMQSLLNTPPPPGKRVKRIKRTAPVAESLPPNDDSEQTCFRNMAFVHRQSCEGVKSELDIFAVPPTQTSIEDGRWVEHQPLTSLDSGGPIEFVIPGTGDAYLDLANTYLLIRAKVVRGVGTDLAADTPVAPVNNWLHSLFSQVDVYLNDTLVTPSSNTYPFRAYVDTVLSYGAEAKYTQLTSQLWYKDTAGHMDATTVDGGNTGLIERQGHIAESRIVEMMGRLHVDLFLQDRFLLNGVSVKIRLVRSKDAFSLMAGGQNPDYKVQIVDAVLFARNAVLSPTVQMAHIKALEKGTAKYPIRPVDCKVYSIPQGAMSHTHENLFLGTLPKRLILWCIDNNAYNGEYSKNPFNAKNNAINFLAVYVDGRQVPAKPLQPNFENGSYIRSYVNLFSATGKQAQDEGNDLSRDDFGQGYTFFGFDLTPDGCDGCCFHLTRKGNLRIEMHFATALEHTVNVVVYGEFEAVLEIDKGRNIIYNY